MMISISGWVLEDSVFVVVWGWCDVLLLVLNAGQSELVAVSICIMAVLSFGIGGSHLSWDFWEHENLSGLSVLIYIKLYKDNFGNKSWLSGKLA